MLRRAGVKVLRPRTALFLMYDKVRRYFTVLGHASLPDALDLKPET